METQNAENSWSRIALRLFAWLFLTFVGRELLSGTTSDFWPFVSGLVVMLGAGIVEEQVERHYPHNG